MAQEPRRPVAGAPIEALKSDPHENARRAEEIFDDPRRSEQEEAMRERDRAAGTEEAVLRDVATTRPPD